MKNYKYIGLLFLSLGFIACDVNNELDEINGPEQPQVSANANGVDFSNYVAIGASFTAGYTDGALFKAGQQSSFPNILASKFTLVGGGEFKQPLMADNIGGLLFGGTKIQEPRLYFNGVGPTRLPVAPTTETTTSVKGDLNNYGIPGAKSFHLVAPDYGNVQGVPVGLANPYFARMSSTASATVLGDALAQQPTFFTLSEIGGNDVLGFATSGGFNPPTQANPSGTNAVYQSTNTVSPATYGANDITNVDVFASVIANMVDALTANGRKGVIANLPYITDLPYFTTVPFNPIPMDAATAGAVNSAYAPYNGGIQQAFGVLVQMQVVTQAQAEAEIAKRTINFAAGQNAVVIVDESLIDLGSINSAFAGLKQFRQATAKDLLVLPSSSFIGTLANPSNPASVNGVAVPLADMWVLTPEEQTMVITATDAYNVTIQNIATAKGLAFVDFKGILAQAKTGLKFDKFNLTTNLVTGGLVSLDGIHLTGRGYALMANKMLAAIDLAYGSNFAVATNGLAKAKDYPTNYSPTLQ